jgi:hypothetical protein
MERPGKHPKLISPWGDVVSFSLSPSSRNALTALKAQVRRIERARKGEQ